MSRQALDWACAAFYKFNASVIVLPTAYEKKWETEKRLKIAHATACGIDAQSLIFIKAVENTFDEISGLADALKNTKSKRLIVVAEWWHMPRSLYVLRRLFPELNIIPVKFKCTKFDEQDEPYSWKRWRSKRKWAWRLTNVLTYLLSPVLIRKVRI